MNSGFYFDDGTPVSQELHRIAANPDNFKTLPFEEDIEKELSGGTFLDKFEETRGGSPLIILTERKANNDGDQ